MRLLLANPAARTNGLQKSNLEFLPGSKFLYSKLLRKAFYVEAAVACTCYMEKGLHLPEQLPIPWRAVPPVDCPYSVLSRAQEEFLQILYGSSSGLALLSVFGCNLPLTGPCRVEASQPGLLPWAPCHPQCSVSVS